MRLHSVYPTSAKGTTGPACGPRPGRVVSGRLPSSLMRACGKPDFNSWRTIGKPRGHSSDLYSSLFGSAIATGTVTRVLCDNPPVAEIRRGSGKTVVVLVTRVHGEAA